MLGITAAILGAVYYFYKLLVLDPDAKELKR